MTKIQITTRDFDGGFGPQLMLVDQDGDVLPGQETIILECTANDVTKATVTFIVDGGDVKVIANDPE